MSMDEKQHSFNKKRAALIAACFLAAAAVIAGVIFGVLFYTNVYTITFSVPASETVTLEFGDTYEEEEVTAAVTGTHFHKDPVSLEVIRTYDGSDVSPSACGTYVVRWTASYKKVTAEAVRTVIVQDTTAPEIELVADPDAYTLPHQAYEEEGYTATDLCDGDLTDMVIAEENDGVVTYTVSDKAGNTTTVTRDIVYKDPEPPVLTVNSEDSVTIEAGSSYTLPSYTASDNVDGDLTDKVTQEGGVDASVPGTYTLTWKVSDEFGNTAEKTVTVQVVDTTAPVITLGGSASVSLIQGGSYSEAGYSAADTVSGDLTAAVAVSGGVDTNTPGTYKITYTVADAAGNTVSAVRTVTVTAKQTAQAVSQAEASGSKIIYLTFDDGPGPYTQQLLDVLNKYNVKATFFVTGQFPQYLNLIASEASAGHTVAIHSYTHNYAQIYSSVDAYFADLNQMSSVVSSLTGQTPTIIRFPGGSSNTVSRNYCSGIMSTLVNEVTARGYTYVDWNVSSGDAEGAQSTAQIVSNVIAGCSAKNVSVVLQHDIQAASVAGVEQIITWGLANGYTFLPLSASSPTVHHSVFN